MKSEERHRLHESELEKLGRHAHSFWETSLKDYAKTALIAVAVAVVVAGGLTWYFVSSNNSRAERWNKVISASFDQDPSQSLVQLENAATNYADYPAGQWAALELAEGALSEGIRLSRTNRPAAVEELVRARDTFAKLASADSEELQERRAFGMARTLEALAGVDVSKDEKGDNVKGVEDALSAYEKFVKDYPDSIFVSLADNRIKALKKPETQKFYTWYRDQYPRPEDRSQPKDGMTPPPAGGSGLPAGHPPISMEQKGTAPPFPEGSTSPPSSDGGTAPPFPEGSDTSSGQPASAEKPMSNKGPELTVPKTTPDAEKTTPEKSAPESNKKDVKPTPEAEETKPAPKAADTSKKPEPDASEKKPAPETTEKKAEKPAPETGETKPEPKADEKKPESTPK